MCVKDVSLEVAVEVAGWRVLLDVIAAALLTGDVHVKSVGEVGELESQRHLVVVLAGVLIKLNGGREVNDVRFLHVAARHVGARRMPARRPHGRHYNVFVGGVEVDRDPTLDLVVLLYHDVLHGGGIARQVADVLCALDELAELAVHGVHVLVDGEDDHHVLLEQSVPDLAEGGVVLVELLVVEVRLRGPGGTGEAALGVVGADDARTFAVVRVVGILVGQEDDHLANLLPPTD